MRGIGIALLAFIAVLPQALAQTAQTPSQAEAALTETIPENTLGPVTLKASLQQTKILPLTLDDALKLAEGQNVTIAIENETVTQRKLDYQYRLSDLLPDIVGEYRQSRFVGGTQVFGGETVSVFRTTYQPQVTARYSIYTAGQNIFEIRASKQRMEAEKNTLEQTRQDTLSQVALGYYDLQLAYWQKAIALQAIKEATTEVSLNQARLDAGVGVKLDVLQAENQLALQKQALVTAENTIAKASQHLAQLLALDFQVDVVPASLEATVTKIAPEEVPFADQIATLRQQHPQLKALSDLRNATRTDIKAAKASVFPRLDLTTYVNGTGPRLNGLIRSEFAGVYASTNLLENMGVGTLVRVKTAKSLSKLADLNLTQARQQLEESLANSVVEMKTQQARIDIAKESLNVAREAYNQALGRLREGVGTNLDLITAMTNLTRARSDLASAFLNFNKAQVTLLTSLGVASRETLTKGYLPKSAAASGS